MKVPADCRGEWIPPYQQYQFIIADRRVTVVCPLKERPGRPWAWKGEFLDAFPETELALLAEGLHIVYLADPDQFGWPDTVHRWDRLHQVLVHELGFAARPALTGLSRGGLYCYNWAIANPEKVACIYADAPVCDFRSWPGGRGAGPGSAEDWRLLLQAYGFASDDEAMAYPGNPVDNLVPLANHGVPLLHVFGDADEVVPWEENTGVVTDRYRRLGGDISLVRKDGGLHHPHGLADPAPIVDFILKHI